MSKLIIEPEKKVRDFKDIEYIINAISERMDEPSLEGKKITTFVLKEEKDITNKCKVFKIVHLNPEKLTRKQNKFINAFYVQPALGEYHLFLKSDDMSIILPAYYQELGHIANDEFVQKYGQTKASHLIIYEAAADAFMEWAMGELNQINSIYCEADLSALYKVKEWQSMSENQDEINPVWVAANDMLVWLYGSDIGNSRDIYKWLCKYIRDEEKLNLLCRVVDKKFLKKN